MEQYDQYLENNMNASIQELTTSGCPAECQCPELGFDRMRHLGQIHA